MVDYSSKVIEIKPSVVKVISTECKGTDSEGSGFVVDKKEYVFMMDLKGIAVISYAGMKFMISLS
jgi:hypothetical protein